MRKPTRTERVFFLLTPLYQLSMKKLLIFVITLLHFTAPAQTLEADRKALVKFFNGTNGPQWTNKTNWTSDAVSPCEWYGVGCTNGRVTHLNLFNNNLSGTVPIEKEDFTALKVLELALNKLSGTIPAELGNLSNLERLAISNNQLYGQLPPKLANLPNLKELVLAGNYLTGPIPPAIFNMPNLTAIALQENQLSGKIPNAIGRASKLQQLHLDNNLLEGPLPDSLGYLPDLAYVSIYNNRITGSIPTSLGNLKKLVLLWLSYNQLSGSIPEELSDLPILESVDLRRNQLSGNIPSSLGRLSKLRFFNAEQNFLTGSLPPELGNLTNLYGLGLGFNQLTGAIPQSYGNMSSMQSLYLANNQLSDTIPPSLNALSKLTDLNISYNQFSGTIPDLSALPTSAVLNFSSNKFTFSGMESNIAKLDYYAPQALLPLTLTGKTLSVDAGGTMSNNTYRWFKNDVQVAANKGNNTLILSEDGYYRVVVNNDIVPNLTLFSTQYSYSQNPLPVSLVNFSARPSVNGNLISWTTTSETNNAGFEIERSADAKSFVSIAKVDGKGDSKSLNNYQFIDKSPLEGSYYKLKQIDYDGTVTYSRQVFVRSEVSYLKLFPNPTKGDFVVESTDSGSPVFIYNLSGQKVFERKGSTSNTIPTDQLKNGLYVIQVGSQATKLVVEK